MAKTCKAVPAEKGTINKRVFFKAKKDSLAPHTNKDVYMKWYRKGANDCFNGRPPTGGRQPIIFDRNALQDSIGNSMAYGTGYNDAKKLMKKAS